MPVRHLCALAFLSLLHGVAPPHGVALLHGVAPLRDVAPVAGDGVALPHGVALLHGVAPLRDVAPVHALAPAGAVAQAREEITDYDVRIEVLDGNQMLVSETIAVRVLGAQIRRGIYRDFPTSFPRSSGLGRIEAPFEVLEVARDGEPETYMLERIGGSWGRGGVRVRIGDPDVLLEHGIHRYTIRYQTARWLTFGDDSVELYWNVTGNGWDFPIARASAQVVLPRSLPGGPSILEVWTGPEGATGADATTRWDAVSNAAVFETTRPLGPTEGMTVRVVIPNGIVEPVAEATRRRWFWMDWGPYVRAGVVVGLVFGLYLLMWSRVGRDPPASTVVVRYEPPEGFSPAALGYLEQKGYDSAHLTATLVSLAVQGAIRIERDGKRWTLHRTGGAVPGLAPEERRLLDTLLGTRKSLSLSSYSGTLRSAIRGLRTGLKGRIERRYFQLNRRWFVAGLAVSVFGLLVLMVLDRYAIHPAAWFLVVWLAFWTFFAATLLVRCVQGWRTALRGGGVGAWVTALVLTVFSAPFWIAEIAVVGLLLTLVPQVLALAALVLGAVNVAFYHLLERPTLAGRGVLNEVAGFKRFLTTAESDRLDRLTPPDQTPELFERFLPHAIALGVENRWAERFEGTLIPQASGAAAVSSGALSWYAGGGGADQGFSGLTSSLGRSFSNSLSSASSPPSGGGGGGGSSSSGGGSSGGGGGGGGGGGW